jgi:hypothetical protein
MRPSAARWRGGSGSRSDERDTGVMCVSDRGSRLDGPNRHGRQEWPRARTSSLRSRVFAPRHYALCSVLGLHRPGAPRSLSPCQGASSARSSLLEAPRPVQAILTLSPKEAPRAQDRYLVAPDA